MLRKLPLSGVQTFADVINDFAVYVDKTAYIHKMISTYKTVFFSRPRRFGKSLTCSTIRAIFENKRELFKDLAIEGLEWEWKEYPVIHLGMSADNFTEGKERLVKMLINLLESNAEKYGVVLPEGGSAIKLKYLLGTLGKKEKVAVIIDEYDSPMLDTIDYPTIHEEIKEELRGFYKVLKDCDEYIKFTFITGITKFSQVGLFSGMNQPEDISLSEDYSALCGFTQKELESYFAPEIEDYSKVYDGKENYLARLKTFYNGYRFAENSETVYNPISIMKHFGNSGHFRVFWAETGTPKFFSKYMDKNSADIVEVEDMELPPEAFGKYSEDEISLVPLMYQAGYLTIESYDEVSMKYKLKYPNAEVRSSFADFLSKQSTGLNIIKRQSYVNKIFYALRDGDVDKFMQSIQVYMQNIKFDLISKMTEYYFEFAFSNILNMLGFNCEVEVHSAIGSVDAVVKLQNNVFVIEAKLDKPIESALKQIEDRKYYVPYLNGVNKVFKIGVVFSGEERNVKEWRCV